jgi:hypothetical protein
MSLGAVNITVLQLTNNVEFVKRRRTLCIFVSVYQVCVSALSNALKNIDNSAFIYFEDRQGEL